MSSSLLEALEVIKKNSSLSDENLCRCALYIGSTPLTLKTMLYATLCESLPGRRVEVLDGQYGDLLGSLTQLASGRDTLDFLIVVIEWDDLDPRLGLRSSAGWNFSLDEVLASVRAKLALFLSTLGKLAERMPIIVSPPLLPFLPFHHNATRQASAWKAGIKRDVGAFVESLASVDGVRVLDADVLSETEAWRNRYSVDSHLAHGFPYSFDFASLLARHLAALALPAAPMKGIVVDLDDTLWKGILGEDGLDGVSWDLDCGSHIYAVFQSFLQSLAVSGVLLAVASKNDASRVEEIFQKRPMPLKRESFFPLMANWGAKSLSIRAILDAWNIHADSVAFIDDSPLEIEEVRSRIPELKCFLFPKQKPGDILDMIRTLRDLYGKEQVTEEDALRLDSLRRGAETLKHADMGEEDYEGYLRDIGTRITLHEQRGVFDKRAFELVNKTNQFNMNGTRCSEAEWRAICDRPDGFVLVASYEDKFGPLGKIAVMAGYVDNDHATVTHWVMSCRAFGRRIEYAMLRSLFSKEHIEAVTLSYKETPRNTVFKEFIDRLATVNGSSPNVTRDAFSNACPALYHAMSSDC